jgi:hypothetical protein
LGSNCASITALKVLMQRVKGHSTEIDNLEELEDIDDILEDGTDCGIFDPNIKSKVTL